MAHYIAARAQDAEPAFSEDEFEGIDMEGVPTISAEISPGTARLEEDVSEVRNLLWLPTCRCPYLIDRL